MDLDTILPVSNTSDLTIQTLVDRLQRSRSDEQFIYRESELDELWRLVDVAIGSAGDDARSDEQLRQMRDAIHRAHDLIGMDGKPLEAAAALREALI